MRCKGTTIKNKRCKRNANENSDFCTFHEGEGVKKASKAEIELRVLTIAEMIIKGQSRQDVLRYSSTTWRVTDRTTDEYIASAHSKIKASVERQIETHKDIALGRYEDLYKRNFNIQDYRECRQVQSDIVKLLGLEEPQKLEHTGKDGGPIETNNVVLYLPDNDRDDTDN